LVYDEEKFIINQIQMLTNYLKIAWRNLWNNKVHSTINIFGLALGIACSLLIIYHVKEELRYDKGFTKADRIYRITLQEIGDGARHWAATSPPLGVLVKEEIPEIKNSARFYRFGSLFSHTSEAGEVKRFEEKNGFFADADAVDMFDLAFSRGDAATALSVPNAIILSETMARKYFGKEDPLGKTIQDDNKKLPLKVTGVVKNFSFPSHLQFDYLVSMATISKYLDQRSQENRSWSAFYTYVLLDKARSAATVQPKLSRFMVKYYEATGETKQEILSTRKLLLQPITSIHLHSKLEKEMAANSDIAYVYIFSIAALFILLVAAVNFINISTAQAFNRMKEIGLRKVVGATRPQLVRQFLGESFLITLLATVIALIVFNAVMPFYNHLTGKSTPVEQVASLSNVGLLLLLILSIGLLAGLYPAWFVARFNPVNSLKGKRNTASPVNLVRKGLVVFQFVVSVFMIFSTVVIYRQMRLFHNKDLGFDKQQLVAVTMYEPMWQHFGKLIHEMDKNSAIAGYSVASHLPGERFGMHPFKPIGTLDDEEQGCRVMYGDDKLLPTLRISLAAGRNFFSQFPDIKQTEFIINEAAVKVFQLKDPVGNNFVLDGDTGSIVGVVKDFNFASLHMPIEPMVIQYNPYRANYLLLKVQPGQLPQTLQFMESNIKSLSPSSAFSYTFIDDKLNRLYDAENRMSQVFKVFAAFAIFISCLGLFGLSAYAARLRTKEIGVRKVLGASVPHVTLLLSKDFMVLVLLATLIAWPIAWFTMSRWLDGFAYRVGINGWVFVLSGIFAMLVALLTVSFHAIKAALLNPVNSLKSE
jgi:putative ABC transport system permease protein